ncbi:MAG TPA: hypothetical protein ENJ65_00530, partial [Candidatus Tenderia electrophaga]|nr:hypothetical protein [Candidatus Tenderia electrophaga]
MKALIKSATLLCCQLLLLSPASANTTTAITLSSQTSSTHLISQRADFAAARKALRQGNKKQYKKLAKGLTDYPLYPYLEYWYINRNLNKVSAEKITGYIQRNSDLPSTGRLKNNWLKKLAQQGKWQLLVDNYSPTSNTKLQCYYRRGLYKTGNKAAAFDGLEKLWLVGKSQPRACDPLFSAWQDAGHLTSELAWQRIVLALNNGQVYLARYLERFLDKPQRRWSKIWREIHRHPERMLSNKHLKQDIDIVRTILAHGVRRMARSKPSKAAQLWDKLVMEFAFSESDFNKTETYIAIRLARKQAPEAAHWLKNINSDDEKVREWRILSAINQDNWDDAIVWFYQLTRQEQQSLRWRYWLARSLEQTGKPNRAQLIYTELAKSRDYYGFMAADRIESDYSFENRPLQFSRAELDAIANLPGMLRAREFYLLNDSLYASREWYAAIQNMSKTDVQKVAKITHDWGWHARAIHSLGQARYLDDLDIRFPTAHLKQINSNARQQKIDPSWAYAVVRQESAFASDAHSPVGAMGLMQIMPSTGRLIARDLNTQLRNKMQLLDVDTNIRF